MIPNGGLDMDCRRCGEAFTIEAPSDPPPDTTIEAVAKPFDDEETPGEGLAPAPDTATGPVAAERTSVGAAPVPESTRVGVANPFEPDTGERPLIGPGGLAHDPSGFSTPTDETPAASTDPKASPKKDYHDRPTVPITTDHVPLGPDEAGLDPELDDTIRFGVDSQVPSAPAPAVTEPGDDDDMVFADPSEVQPRAVSASSVYDRVAQGVAIPDEPKKEISSAKAPKPRSVGSLLRPSADRLNRAPLALKVAFIVFPVTLGVMLFVGSNGAPAQKDAPIPIPIEADAPEPKRLVEPEPSEPGEDPPPDRPLAGEALPEGDDPVEVDDRPAPSGFAYVQVEAARLRGRPTDSAPFAGRLEIGSLVKVYDEVHGFALVHEAPDGAAGFISRRLLADRRPVALLAREQPFEQCAPTPERTVDDCLFGSRQQEQTCLDRCGAVNAGNEADRLRCAQACNIAFDNCASSCRGGPPPKRIRKRSRR